MTVSRETRLSEIKRDGSEGPITYAKAGGPPRDWTRLKVFDGDQELLRCKEVNTVEGWAVIVPCGPNGKPQRDAGGNRFADLKIISDKLRIERASQ